MNGISQVRDCLLHQLHQAQIPAEAAFSHQVMERRSTGVICLSVGRRETESEGFGDYLGQKTDADGNWQEIYGKRMELLLEMWVYVPAEQGAQGCEELSERTTQVLLGQLPSGLRLRSLKWEQVEWDKNSTMFLQKGQAVCRACFIASASEETEAALLDFELKGVVST